MTHSECLPANPAQRVGKTKKRKFGGKSGHVTQSEHPLANPSQGDRKTKKRKFGGKSGHVTQPGHLPSNPTQGGGKTKGKGNGGKIRHVVHVGPVGYHLAVGPGQPATKKPLKKVQQKKKFLLCLHTQKIFQTYSQRDTRANRNGEGQEVRQRKKRGGWRNGACVSINTKG